MKKIIFVILALFAVVSLNCFALAAEDASSIKVVAYYLHGSFRCSTCTNMEKYSKDALETNFKDALTSGKLEFKSLNVEDRGNEHFVDHYKLYTKSLILSLVKNGKEVKYKNLDKIWELASDKQKFIDYVISEINGFMKDVR